MCESRTPVRRTFVWRTTERNKYGTILQSREQLLFWQLSKTAWRFHHVQGGLSPLQERSWDHETPVRKKVKIHHGWFRRQIKPLFPMHLKSNALENQYSFICGMFACYSTGQNFDVWIDTALLFGDATKASRTFRRQTCALSNSVQLNSARKKCDVFFTQNLADSGREEFTSLLSN